MINKKKKKLNPQTKFKTEFQNTEPKLILVSKNFKTKNQKYPKQGLNLTRELIIKTINYQDKHLKILTHVKQCCNIF